MQPRHRFLVDVSPTIPLYVMSPRPYTFLENTYMCGKGVAPPESGPKELLPRHFYYPASGLFLIEDKLITLGGSSWGRRFWIDAFQAADVVLSLTTKIVDDRVMVRMTHTTRNVHTRHDIPCTWESTAFLFHNGVLLTVLVKRLQRAVLKFLERLARPRRLALAMGQDARLGALSPLSMLPPDLFRNLVRPLV